MSTAPLTTTSYAILGLLSVKPWTTYELAQQMDRAIGLFWPRTRSKLYEEPKKLVAHGLANASFETVGRRPRTVYSITPAGRRSLAAWTKTPSSPPVLEWDLLLKVFFAEHGSKQDLLATLESMSGWLEASASHGAAIARPYLDGQGPFPERLPWILLVGQFLDQFSGLVEEWTEWATGVVESWPDDVRDADPDLVTLERMVRRNEEYPQRLAARRVAAAADGSPPP